MGFWGVLLIILGILVIVGVISYLLEKRRTEALLKLAAKLKLTFIPNDKDKVLRHKYTAFKLFDKGHSRKLFNIMEGKTEGLYIRIFDYEYIVGRGGRSARVEQQTVVHFTSERLKAPIFFMRPEGFMERIGTALMGMQDIDFQSNPTFSANYLLQSAYEREVRAFFNETRLAYFANHKDWFIEARNHEIIIYRLGYRSSINNTETYFQQAIDILHALSEAPNGEITSQDLA